jgi:hypothetical protein
VVLEVLLGGVLLGKRISCIDLAFCIDCQAISKQGYYIINLVKPVLFSSIDTLLHLTLEYKV